MSFITDDFLLRNDTARRLYHAVARDLPIIDYHCHLPPAAIAADHRFADLFEIWLAGDHYKWRAMRANGVGERYCTGNAPPREKFLAFARTLPKCLRNPLYHWSHLELKRYFGIDRLLNEDSAPGIWEEANALLADPSFSARGILARFRVSVVCTTDDPVDSLEHHRAIAAAGIGTRVYPTFRPDQALAVGAGAAWNTWVDRLEAASGVACGDLDGFLDALGQRHDHFHNHGCRLSDHGLEVCPATAADRATAAAIYQRARTPAPAGQWTTQRSSLQMEGPAPSGPPADDTAVVPPSGGTRAARAGSVQTSVTPAEAEAFAGFLLDYLAGLDHARGWTKQLHLGALRNANPGLYEQLGPDIGCDSIGDGRHARPLASYLGRLSAGGILPKMVLYNLNPADNYVFATMAGNFQAGAGMAGKIQFGSGWWFLDQKDGMTWQLNALSNLGVLGNFVGMLTDSRSFMSYCRHEYFRRLLCQMLGADVENGELPDDFDLLVGLVRAVCHDNAARYFGLELGAASAGMRK